jgi:Putative beta barrel porin-7 (BBP7)
MWTNGAQGPVNWKSNWHPPEFAPGSRQIAKNQVRTEIAAPPEKGTSWAKGKPMETLFGSFRYRHGFVASRFLCTLLATLLLPITASAADQENSTGKSADRERSPPSFRQTPVDRPESTPRWTVSAEAIVLERIGGVSRTLVERVPGSVPFIATLVTPGTEAFNSNAFRQGFSAGPKISLTYHGDSGYGAELSYFNVFGRSATKAIGPDSPADWLVMRAPGIFWQTQDFANQAMAWSATTNLYNAEANGRLDLSSRVTLLAGFRWLQLNDNLQGTLTPPDQTAPTWKSACPGCNIFQITPGDPAGNYPPFWNTITTNNLYGVQIGVNGKILELGRFSLDGLIKFGLFENHAGQSTGVSLQKVVYPSQATANHAAFVSEAGLQLKYQLNRGLALKAGYQALWLDGVALAPGQIQETLTLSTVRALGVNCGSSVLFQGATFGLEYSF